MPGALSLALASPAMAETVLAQDAQGRTEANMTAFFRIRWLAPRRPSRCG